MKNGTKAKRFLFLNLGVLLMAIGIYFFKAPNGFATGGVSGLAILLAKALWFLPITQSMYLLAINAILLVIGVIILAVYALNKITANIEARKAEREQNEQ